MLYSSTVFLMFWVVFLLLAFISASAVSATASSNVMPSQTVVGVHIPWAVGGERIERDGTKVIHPGEWPDFKVDSVRLWDTRTAWLNVEPAQDRFNFSVLDANVLAASTNNVQNITLVLWGTPKWAASSLSSSDAFWLGEGSASPPSNMSDWENYVRTVVTRYKGQIQAYQIGNETNVSSFWRGSDTELASLVLTAARIIKEVDPEALVVAPSHVFGNVTESSPSLELTRNFWKLLSVEKNLIDALSFHWYPSSRADPNELKGLAKILRTKASEAGMPGVSLWLTEVNRYRNKKDTSFNASKKQSAWVVSVSKVAEEAKLDKVYWYAWTDLKSLDFIQFTKGSLQEKALQRALE